MINGNSLIVYIKSIATILNGEVPDVKDTNFSSDFRPVRYGIVLLAALVDPLGKNLGGNKLIQNFTCVNIYRLWKVARLCGLIFDRTRTAEKVYRDLEAKQMVIFFTVENRTYITFTKGGQRMHRQLLEELISLK